jgi:SAM-dependent methyltransferase
MINQVHAYFHRPEKGWDPIPSAYGEDYANAQWQSIDYELIEKIGHWIGGFHGKRILDLGSGPGQYAIAFAQRGAEVTCHDVSNTYIQFAQNKADALGVSDRIRFSIGYLDEAPALLRTRFDFVFNRLCWYYGFGDRSFARAVFSLVGAGGYCYVDTPHTAVNYGTLGSIAKFRMWLNSRFSIKVGHPYPPHGRVERIFLEYPIESMRVDYSDPCHDRIWFRKAMIPS